MAGSKAVGRPLGAEPVNAGKRRRWLRLEYLLLAAFLAFVALKFVERAQQIQAMQREEVALRYENRVLARDNARTRNRVEYERSMQYVQEAARSILAYTLPNETTIQVNVIHPRLQPRVMHRPRTVPPPRPIWQRWWQSIFG
jgi:cell division protein FtsB